MLSKELKKLIEATGGKYIITEDGKPKYAVMDFEEYKNTIVSRKPLQLLTENELIDKINSDIASWREKQPEKVEDMMDEIEKLEDVEYEVLPK